MSTSAGSLASMVPVGQAAELGARSSVAEPAPDCPQAARSGAEEAVPESSQGRQDTSPDWR